MARPRERHVQQELLDSTGTQPKSKRGGKRTGAGRPPNAKRAGSPHKKRPAFKASSPLHVVLRVEEAMGSLRRRCMWHAVRSASITVASRDDFRIVHVSVQRTHLHLLVEADSTGDSISARFQASAARLVRGSVRGRRGGLVHAARARQRVTRAVACP